MNELEEFILEMNPIIEKLNQCFEKHLVDEKCISLRFKNEKIDPIIFYSDFCDSRNSK